MKHFTIEELTHSDTAIGHGIANNPGAVERENLRRRRLFRSENGGKRRFARSFLTEIGCRGLKNVKNKAKPLNIRGLAFIVEFSL